MGGGRFMIGHGGSPRIPPEPPHNDVAGSAVTTIVLQFSPSTFGLGLST